MGKDRRSVTGEPACVFSEYFRLQAGKYIIQVLCFMLTLNVIKYFEFLCPLFIAVHSNRILKEISPSVSYTCPYLLYAHYIIIYLHILQ